MVMLQHSPWSQSIPLLVGAVLAAAPVLAAEIQPEFVMFHEPELSQPVVELRLNESLLPLWRQALTRPEADFQRMAANAIAEAAEEGFPGMAQARADLLRLLEAEATHPAARFAAARALIALDARSSASTLFAIAQAHGSQLRWLIEPALIRWDFEPIRAVWRERLRDPQTHRRELILALDGLARASDVNTLSLMLNLMHSAERPSDVRLSAARAAGVAVDSGLEPEAVRLLERRAPTILHRLCAVALLRRHTSAHSRELLAGLARDEDPTVKEQALGVLHSIDPALVLSLAEDAMQNADPKVRQRGADAFFAVPTPARMAFVSRLLDDPHPDVRGSVRDDLFRTAQQEGLSESVRSAAMDVLSGESWRGQEQASLLLGALDHEPAAIRLLQLLHGERAEVEIASAWALRKLAAPATLPEIHAHAQRQSTARRNHRGTAGLDKQVAHLFEAMAMMNYRAGEPLMREYIPKIRENGYYSRGAAIWALGQFHSQTAPEDLSGQFVERLNDTKDVFNQELDIVWRMSAVALGQMRAGSELPALQQRLQETHSHDPVAYAIRWSIHQISGEDLPQPDPIRRSRSGWFLEPLSEPNSR
jgi:HEAT repeat protein